MRSFLVGLFNFFRMILRRITIKRSKISRDSWNLSLKREMNLRLVHVTLHIFFDIVRFLSAPFGFELCYSLFNDRFALSRIGMSNYQSSPCLLIFLPIHFTSIPITSLFLSLAHLWTCLHGFYHQFFQWFIFLQTFMT